MTERPILFSAPMVRAILDGRKTQTRRVKNIPQNAIAAWLDGMAWRFDLPGAFKMVRCPYGVPGDRLWVRETLKSGPLPNLFTGEPTIATIALYAADDEWVINEHEFNLVPWWKHWEDGRKLPPIHMPRWASRITLEISDVRVQRVQEISEDDAFAEGVSQMDWEYDNGECCDTRRESFSLLWDSIHGTGAWGRNDWVWALTFRRVTA